MSSWRQQLARGTGGTGKACSLMRSLTGKAEHQGWNSNTREHPPPLSVSPEAQEIREKIEFVGALRRSRAITKVKPTAVLAALILTLSLPSKTTGQTEEMRPCRGLTRCISQSITLHAKGLSVKSKLKVR